MEKILFAEEAGRGELSVKHALLHFELSIYLLIFSFDPKI